MSNESITSVLKEARRFEPPAEFAASARIELARRLRAPLQGEPRRPRHVLAARVPGPRASAGRRGRETQKDVGSSRTRVVRGREAQHHRELPRPAPVDVAREQGRDPLGGRARRDAHVTYASSTARRQARRTRCARLGVGKGDRVAIYMGMVPEVVVAMLACARLGAVHTVIFGGFAADALRDRIGDCQAKVVITQDGGYRRGNVLALKEVVDGRRAARGEERRRRGRATVTSATRSLPVHMKEGRDLWWHEIVERHAQRPAREATVVDGRAPALHPLHLGLDGKPKGVLHTTAGYLVGRARHLQVRLRSPRRRRLLVHRRRRLGHRPQLHRVRARSRTARRA
jgi:acetyl-CoA synthetase